MSFATFELYNLMLKVFCMFIGSRLLILVLDFGRLYKMMDVLHRCKVQDVDFPTFFSNPPNSTAYRTECQKVLNVLMTQGMYEDAYLFGHSAGLDLSHIVLKQVCVYCWQQPFNL